MSKQINKSTVQQVFKEYKPSILFLLRFLSVYIIGNIIYGFYVVGFENADPITQLVSSHTVYLLKFMGYNASDVLAQGRATTILYLNEASIIEIYEGCNAINVSILFIAFLFSYKGSLKATLIFSLIGLASIYVFNLFRLVGLVYVVLYYPNQLYLMHKFVFTGVIYAFVFFLWFIWIKKWAN